MKAEIAKIINRTYELGWWLGWWLVLMIVMVGKCMCMVYVYHGAWWRG